MTKSTKLEPLTISEDDMMAIVAIAKSLKEYSKTKSVDSLLQHIQTEEFCVVDENKKIIWEKPMLNLVNNIEKKFSKRLKEAKKAGLI